jgi:hypothetical protein
MVHRARAWVLLLVPVLVTAAGCRDKGAATPKQAALNFVKAFRTGDKDLFRATVHAKDMEYAEAFFDTASALSVLFSRLEDAYGPEVMASQDDWHYRKLPDPATAGDRMKIEVDGDSAWAYVPDDAATVGDDSAGLQLVKKDGRWYVDMDLMLRPPVFEGAPQEFRQEMEKALAEVRGHMIKDREAIVAACLEARKKIGRDGYTAERILAETRPPGAGEAAGRDPQVKVVLDGASSSRRGRTYTIAPGDTLIGIAKRIYGPDQGHRHEQIYQANRDKLKSPNRLPIGVTLRLPPA